MHTLQIRLHPVFKERHKQAVRTFALADLFCQGDRGPGELLWHVIACRSHPGIVKLVGFCIDDPVLLPSLVMEYAECHNRQAFVITIFIVHACQCSFMSRQPLADAVLRKQASEEGARLGAGVRHPLPGVHLLDAIDFMHWRLPAPGGPGTAGFCIHRDISPGQHGQSKARKALPAAETLPQSATSCCPTQMDQMGFPTPGSLTWDLLSLSKLPFLIVLDT
eukprot:1159505-Pelagomonas_calceolata.AAC.3